MTHAKGVETKMPSASRDMKGIMEMQRSFRKVGWWLAGALIATGTLTGRATAAPDSEQLELSAHPNAWSDQIKDLDGNGEKASEHTLAPERPAALRNGPGPLHNNIVKLSEVLDKADRDTPKGEKCGLDVHPKEGFCWNKDDNKNKEWFPQGLTASWDALADGKWEGRTVVAASWYLKGTDDVVVPARQPYVKKGDEASRALRVSFADRGEGKEGKYDFVALVKPTKDGRDIEPLDHVHAGGLAWVGHYLYVADTRNGLRVFDLHHIWKAETGSKDYKVANGEVSAGGYKYVLPQIGYYLHPKGQACKEEGARPVYSSASVDRKTKTLVTGEYCGGKGDGSARIIRWPLESDNGELTGLLKEANHKVESRDWYRTKLDTMQGVVTHGDDVWMTASFSEDRNGKWYKNSLAELKPGDTLPKGHESTMCTPGPEDLTYKSEDSVWTLTEHPGERQVFPIQDSNGKDCTKAKADGGFKSLLD